MVKSSLIIGDCQVSEEALRIIKEHSLYDNISDCLIVDVIEFENEDDASFLSGAFDGVYGLVTISKKNDSKLKSLSDLLHENDVLLSEELKKNEDSRISLDKLLEDFITSKSGKFKDKIETMLNCPISPMKFKEFMRFLSFTFKLPPVELFLNRKDKEIEKKYEERRKCINTLELTKEKPYFLYLCGNDDSSWGRSFSTIEDCLFAVECIKRYKVEYVNNMMYFTN